MARRSGSEPALDPSHWITTSVERVWPGPRPAGNCLAQGPGRDQVVRVDFRAVVLMARGCAPQLPARYARPARGRGPRPSGPGPGKDPGRTSCRRIPRWPRCPQCERRMAAPLAAVLCSAVRGGNPRAMVAALIRAAQTVIEGLGFADGRGTRSGFAKSDCWTQLVACCASYCASSAFWRMSLQNSLKSSTAERVSTKSFHPASYGRLTSMEINSAGLNWPPQFLRVLSIRASIRRQYC